jgi:CRISPR-associated protein Cmr1
MQNNLQKECTGLNITFKTFTPIWTGDIDNKSVKILENGILGSLRWWSEAINRGFGYSVCDPTNDTRCPNENQEYCCICNIFGATGKQRLFKIICDGGDSLFSNNVKIKPHDRNGGWFYPESGLMAEEISVKFIPLNQSFMNIFIHLPIAVLSNWGSIGAKPQLGYGVINQNSSIDLNLQEYSRKLIKLGEPRKNISNQNYFPNLKDFFFAKIQFRVNTGDWWKKIDGISQHDFSNIEKWIKQGTVPVYPAIKNWLRFGNGSKSWKSEDNYQNQRIENYLFGTIRKICPNCYTALKEDNRNRGKFWCPNCRNSFPKEEILERNASKINISFAYQIDESNWEFRLWGWIPKSTNIPFNNQIREEFLNNLRNALNDNPRSLQINWQTLLGSHIENPSLLVWREFNSDRDSIQNFTDYTEFIQSLISEGDD